MKIGTKSLLYGAHAFWLHPIFVTWAWIKLYGFPWQPWLWIAFVVHDWGYWGMPNMDGPEGEEHPRTGARILNWLQGTWLFIQQPVFWSRPYLGIPLRWWHLKRRWAHAQLLLGSYTHGPKVAWGNEVMFHSRFLSKKYQVSPSKLCWADKLALSLTPWWLYLPMVRATGEIREYRERQQTGERDGNFLSTLTDKEWVLEMQDFCAQLAYGDPTA